MPTELQFNFDGAKRLLGLVEPTYKRVRVVLNGETIADTKNALMLFDHIFAPRFLFHKDDVKWDVLQETDEVTHNRMYATIKHYNITVGDTIAEKAALTFEGAKGKQTSIDEYVGFEWDAMDAWYVEDEEAFGHARHPYHRIDFRKSSRHVQIKIGDQVVADSDRALFLFETALQPRFYIPQEDVKMALFTPTETHTICSYKGEASYYTANIDGQAYEDVVWYYPQPDPGMEQIKDLVAFYNEHDAITILVDGEKVN